MIIDGDLILSENQAISATLVNSKVIYVGPSNKVYHTLFVNVTLTTPFTGGKINKVKLQTASDLAFTTPVDLMEVTLLDGIDQTKTANLTQFRLPAATQDYVRLVYTATSPAGGKVFATLNKEVPLR